MPCIEALAVSDVWCDDTMPTPGAKMSVQEPQLENVARRSLVSVAFTVIASATRAGDQLQASWLALADAIAYVTPEAIELRTAWSMAAFAPPDVPATCEPWQSLLLASTVLVPQDARPSNVVKATAAAAQATVTFNAVMASIRA
ncbi:hypothetical protein AOZ06_43420 [Kibdelosporangium phytohabitans]|uniref:Uncharacterized protein n=1 Tax=Kibdelosporangium phytohabitans TaxID=860235 RepID=A0A0N9I8X9_9PSEU|nr:hypothetical protein AOZ06_43420 [Kibdelosporangium phytohabitans]